jgi:crotonobetainyl-CoA hydratase
MSDAPYTTARNGGVLEVTLTRGKANAIDAATSRQLGETFAAFRDDPSMRVAIVASANPRFFSAGWDLKTAAAGEPPDADYGVGGFGGLQALPNFDKPVIAAVNGMCVGGGFEIALSADLIVAADDARFSLP